MRSVPVPPRRLRSRRLGALVLGLACGMAAARPAPPVAFRLVLHTHEPRLLGGKVQELPLDRAWTMKARGVSLSKKARRFSGLLTPGLNRAQHQIDARLPRPAVFRNVSGRWVARQQTGWRLDRAATKAAILKAILAGKPGAEAVVRLTVPRRSVELLASRGVAEYLTAGTSSYRGSPATRVTNILVGAEKLDNFFVAPGHTFDFNREVGEVDASTGFVKGFVISDGTLSQEDGGGICQVSTTLFRALYTAGLPVVERHAHSHRVKFYDPVGFEATVYTPYKNLRMKNDTGHYLFVQAGWDTRAQTLRFDLFGTRPGRRVRVSPPKVSGFQHPASPSYTPDGRVAANHRRLLDVPVQGMSSTIVRTIVGPDGKARRDILRSVYQPWGAVYGVAKGDPRLH